MVRLQPDTSLVDCMHREPGLEPTGTCLSPVDPTHPASEGPGVPSDCGGGPSHRGSTPHGDTRTHRRPILPGRVVPSRACTATPFVGSQLLAGGVDARTFGRPCRSALRGRARSLRDCPAADHACAATRPVRPRTSLLFFACSPPSEGLMPALPSWREGGSSPPYITGGEQDGEADEPHPGPRGRLPLPTSPSTSCSARTDPSGWCARPSWSSRRRRGSSPG